MSDPETSGLKLKDIKFLRAVRDINENPDQYSGTEGGAMPATVGAIQEATDLTQGDINYRAQPNRSRLAEADYLTIHDPQIRDAGFGPKSFEVTPEGDHALEEAMVAHGLSDADTSELRDDQQVQQLSARTSNNADRLEAIETRLEELAAKVSQLEQTVQRYEDTPTGAMNPGERDKIEALINRVPANSEVLAALGVNLAELEAAESRDEIDADAIQDQVRTTLLDGTIADPDTTSAGDERDLESFTGN